MKINILHIVIGILFTSCYNPNKHINIRQEKCLDSLVYISFSKKENEIKSGVIAFKNKFILKNPHLKQVDIDFYYFRNGDIISFPNGAYFIKRKKSNYYNKIRKTNRIELSFLGNKDIYYFVWNEIDTLDFTNKYYKSLEQYKNLVKPTNMSSVMPDSPNPINENILTYEEPFSEFKRKNPELLEFLTKSDSIELEVISPVKQKYKFKAKW
ncbi:hypothetical protein [Capnocytophaga catalasegens]|uniref:Lipoprotein n=1 Tax=Capnocytophaga catalasegens TaxID=1004260 RepID=A0AAV5AY38_9FLAO|nr:hypothetical protein [Capnocytophaga catalasegens]GIZ16631.1 hypothetical protein RCZ03_26310 [Capnocytophaga catalasegens]GJM51679.1 hypothetical protein RCZ15_26520 [Capnocytophaga catalasegens]GJM54313.1 hypothetical protein RCZ16_26290 [Capnocytophaga catalasegens]